MLIYPQQRALISFKVEVCLRETYTKENPRVRQVLHLQCTVTASNHHGLQDLYATPVTNWIS